MALRGERWAKVVESVLCDLGLSSNAVRVFCNLALWALRGDGKVSRGRRAIAAATGMSRDTVSSAIRQLKERGHIRVDGTGRARRHYFLLSPVYSEKVIEKRKKAA